MTWRKQKIYKREQLLGKVKVPENELTGKAYGKVQDTICMENTGKESNELWAGKLH